MIFGEVESLPTFWKKWFGGGTGDHVRQTDDIYTFLGWVVLASPDEQAMRADYQAIKDLERQIIIDPRPSGSASRGPVTLQPGDGLVLAHRGHLGIGEPDPRDQHPHKVRGESRSRDLPNAPVGCHAVSHAGPELGLAHLELVTQDMTP
jgi:hypothetical protein